MVKKDPIHPKKSKIVTDRNAARGDKQEQQAWARAAGSVGEHVERGAWTCRGGGRARGGGRGAQHDLPL